MTELIYVVMIATSIWVVVDAKSIGVKRGVVKGFADMGPWSWFFGCLLLWIVVFPLYLSKRSVFKRALAGGLPVASDTITQLERLADLKTKGFISQGEFDSKKKSLLGLA